MKDKLYMPCLRGEIGDWVFYSCIMTFQEVAKRITFATIIHESKNLSDLIQRKLEEGRAKKIKNYLIDTQERFFNSMIVAVYGGDPEWHNIGKLSYKGKQASVVSEIPDAVIESIGILSFSGDEKLYALDGQHRLSGIRLALKENRNLENQEISIIFIAHQNTLEGKQRSRRLFTILNKTARPVSKGEIIALDEDDTMAIITRRLIEEHPFFKGDRIAITKTSNMPLRNNTSLTTIINLYDILDIMYRKILYKNTAEKLKRNRLGDEKLENYYISAAIFFEVLIEKFKALREYRDTENLTETVKKYRTKDGGNILFRPIGLKIVIQVIEKLTKKYTYQKAIDLVSKIPQDLSDEPYNNVIWNPSKKTIISTGRALAVDLLLYMLNENKSESELLKKYKIALDQKANSTTLPSKIIN
jgi:DNA sulfur modification protein DndB